MPVISQFYGILIRMFYNDHVPPHFHAVYGEYELIVGISPITILEGKAPNRVKSMVLEWTALHQEELSANWNCCRQGESPSPIDPLE
ncbi:MAG TPA: transcriptional regulator [Cyanobacteria bacterium UBA11162]|nr:transcriptional regulator [Cyanobacteria bacterium UBA11162]